MRYLHGKNKTLQPKAQCILIAQQLTNVRHLRALNILETPHGNVLLHFGFSGVRIVDVNIKYCLGISFVRYIMISTYSMKVRK